MVLVAEGEAICNMDSDLEKVGRGGEIRNWKSKTCSLAEEEQAETAEESERVQNSESVLFFNSHKVCTRHTEYVDWAWPDA